MCQLRKVGVEVRRGRVEAPAAQAATCLSHGQPCSRAHCRTSRCPPSARARRNMPAFFWA